MVYPLLIDMTIRELLNLQPSSARIMRKYGLHYLRCRQMEFEEACKTCSVNPIHVKEEIKSLQFSSTPMDKLLSETMNEHDQVKRRLSILTRSLEKATKRYSSFTLELLTIKVNIEILAEQLEMHLYKEEMILFPEFIAVWSKKYKNSGVSCQPTFRFQYPIERLENEHASTQQIMTEVKKVSEYFCITDKDNSYKTIRNQVARLEKSLNKLIKLENDILFPQALTLESEIYKGT